VRGAGRAGLGCAVALLLALPAAPAAARSRRRLFEPTDLELEAPGVLEVDAQVGLIRGNDAYRLVLPDLEIDLGLPAGFELDLDSSFALEGPDDGSFTYDHVLRDNVWLAAKTGFAAWNDPVEDVAWAIGMQLGPKLPLARGAHGLGVEALALAGVHRRSVQLMLNLGSLIDPAASDGAPRPAGLEGGLDLSVDLVPDVWALTAELGGIVFYSPDPHQLNATLGLEWAPSQRWTLSLVALAGLLSGSDRYGLLLGVSPKLRLLP